MSVEELLQICQQCHIILLTNQRGQAALYAPNVEVNRQIRVAIRKYNHELAQLIRSSSTSVCPSPRLHAAYFGATCYLCQHLDAAIAPRRRQRVA